MPLELKTKLGGRVHPKLQEYYGQVSELRKQYAAETAHFKTRALRSAEERATRRAKADAEWTRYLERMRQKLNDPSIPPGIESMHRTLRAAPALEARRAARNARIGSEAGREERDAAARIRHHDAMAGQVAARRATLALLAEESQTNWITMDNLEARIRHALDNPSNPNEPIEKFAEREATRRRQLTKLTSQAIQSVTVDDITLTPVNPF